MVTGRDRWHRSPSPGRALATPGAGAATRRALRIAVDGPSGSGKSTFARALAEKLGASYLDTGAMYRAVALAAIREGIPLEAEAELAARARSAQMLVGERVMLDGLDVTDAIRDASVDAVVSEVSAHPAVRSELVRRQREWIDAHGDVVVEGRDIGTVVMADASLKIFLTADASERARRRLAQQAEAPRDGGNSLQSKDSLRQAMEQRDHMDSSRDASPLVPASDALMLDTTGRSIAALVATVQARLGLDVTGGEVWQPDTRITPIYRLCRGLVVGFVRAWFRIKVAGRENVPSGGGFVVAPVHRSFIDFAVAATAVPGRKLFYMVKQEIWDIAWLGRLVGALGGIPVNRNGVDRDAVRRAEQVLSAGGVLVIFPEGTRREGRKVTDLQEGAAYLALRANVPVVPVGIAGTDRAMPKGSHWIRPVSVRLRVGEPIRGPLAEPGRRVPRSAIRSLTSELEAGVQDAYDAASRDLGELA